MKSPIVALAVAGTLVAAANAQSPAPAGAKAPANTPGQHALAPGQASSEILVTKQPTQQPKQEEKHAPAAPDLKSFPVDQIKESTKASSADSIEPFLLTKDNGPFMVHAKTFRGPEAERYAIALAKELRSEFGLSAYILRTRDFANRGPVRNVPPRAPAGPAGADLAKPEKARTFDECAVLVGDEKTPEASEKLLDQVKTIKPTCLDALPSIWNNRRYLKNAMRTTNPYSSARDLFPRKLDKVGDQPKQDPQARLNAPEAKRTLLLSFPPVELNR